MFGLGLPELIIILVIVFIIFGARRLPEIGSGLGKAITGFKQAARESPEEPPPSEEMKNDIEEKE